MLGMSTSWSCCYDGALPSTLKTRAAYGGYANVVGLILREGAVINAKDSNGSTALHSAAYGGMSKVVRLLVKNGADIEATDERDRAQSDALTEIPDEVFRRGAMAVKAYLAELSDSLRRCALRCRAEKENGFVRQEIARGTWALTQAIPEASLGLFGPTDMRIDLLDAASTNQIIGHLTCRVSCSSAEKAASVP
ncbi:hypothetical protein P43SY_004613 [Pythium insidiosum]|uniref:Uncharacterized protein n=1 Tax=Pythium insidiosum TaxID=114742 RepID=A0AAD5LTX6_PYTIN|nr:hypothetical protein P43SY_004613 [Pythium insidiosum]